MLVHNSCRRMRGFNNEQFRLFFHGSALKCSSRKLPRIRQATKKINKISSHDEVGAAVLRITVLNNRDIVGQEKQPIPH